MNTFFRTALAPFFVVLMTGASMTGTAFADRNKTTEVVIQTSEGSIKLALYPDRAPVAVANFLKLVDGGTYKDGSFYRVVTKDNDNGSPKIEVIQGGAPDGAEELEGIAHEVTGETGISHEDGTISMARGDIGTATSEFFICIGNQYGLDFGGRRHKDGQGFAAFGKVVEGMDVVRKIQSLPTAADDEDAYVKGQILAKPVTISNIVRFDAEADAKAKAASIAKAGAKAKADAEARARAAEETRAAEQAQAEADAKIQAEAAAAADQADTDPEAEDPSDDTEPTE
jgi:peptidyl-prolyl cis-trans isomerase A (cyclophilin A)